MSDRIEELEARVQQLEQRVSSLEGEKTVDTYEYQNTVATPQPQSLVIPVTPVSTVPPVPPQAAPQQKPPHPGPAPMFYEGMEKKPQPAAQVNADYTYHDPEQIHRAPNGRPTPPPMTPGVPPMQGNVPTFQAAQPQQPRHSFNWEAFIGKNLMGILASVLVFISLVLFAILWLPRLTDGIKIAAMYIFSFALTGVSLYTLKKKENALLLSLSGCGVGSVFISLFVTYYYFHAIGMIPLYILLFVWGVGTWYLSRKFSWLFQIIGQVGLVIALCFGMYYIRLVHDHNMFIGVMIFYVFGSAIYMFTPKANNRMRLMTYICQMLTVLLANNLSCLYAEDVVHNLRIHPILTNEPGIAIGWGILAAYIIVLTMYHFHKAAEAPTEWEFGMGYGYVLNLLYIVYNFYLETVSWACVCLALGVLLFTILTIIKPEKLHITREIWRITMVLVAVIGATNLATYWEYEDIFANTDFIQYMGLIAFVLMTIGLLWNGLRQNDGVSRVLGFIVYIWGASISAEAVDNSGFDVADVIYVVLWLAVPVFTYLWMREHKETYRLSNKITIHAMSLYVVLPMFARCLPDAEVWAPILCWIVMAGCNALAMKTKFGKNWVDESKEQGMWIATTAINAIMMISGMVLMARDENTAMALLVMTIGLMGVFSLNLFGITNRIPAQKSEQKLMEIYVGIKYTVLLVFILTEVEAADYLLDVAVLIFAILFIIFGFLGEKKILRVYGLVLSILAAVKLCLVDIHFDDTGARAASFLICGILCFAISAIYTYVDKKVKENPQGEQIESEEQKQQVL